MRENFFCNKIDRLTRTEVKSIPGLKFSFTRILHIDHRSSMIT